MDQAARYGFAEVVSWLHFNRSEGCTRNAIDLAAREGHFGVVKWLFHMRRDGCSSHAMAMAVAGGQFEIATWLHGNICTDWTGNIVDIAAAKCPLPFLFGCIKPSQCIPPGMQ